jgi:hypothetical protein
LADGADRQTVDPAVRATTSTGNGMMRLLEIAR